MYVLCCCGLDVLPFRQKERKKKSAIKNRWQHPDGPMNQAAILSHRDRQALPSPEHVSRGRGHTHPARRSSTQNLPEKQGAISLVESAGKIPRPAKN